MSSGTCWFRPGRTTTSGVGTSSISGSEDEIAQFSVKFNSDVIKLEKAPKMAVYSPKNKLPWDDAVTLVLKYAEIPYDVVYDEEVIKGDLPKYDWLHLHHEDFTGSTASFTVPSGTSSSSTVTGRLGRVPSKIQRRQTSRS